MESSPLSYTVTSDALLTSTSLLTVCCCDDRRLDRRLDLREPCLPDCSCRSEVTSVTVQNQPPISSRRGTSFSSFFCRLRWVSLSTNHNKLLGCSRQVCQNANQSQQQSTGDWVCHPMTNNWQLIAIWCQMEQPMQQAHVLTTVVTYQKLKEN